MNDRPKISGTRYVLAVKDLERSVNFYRDKLGFTSMWADTGWHQLRRDDCIVMLGECPDDRSAFETVNHSYFAYIDVEQIDALYEELSKAGVDILSGVTDEPWGQREFAIRTVDGHRIRFGQAIDS